MIVIKQYLIIYYKGTHYEIKFNLNHCQFSFLSSANTQSKYYSKNCYKFFCGYSEVHQENIELCVRIRNELEITPITEISCSSCAMNRGLDPLELCSGNRIFNRNSRR